jgi:hypothetical protein
MMRKSLRKEALRVFLTYNRETTTIPALLISLDNVFGTSERGISLLQRFFLSRQQEAEDVAGFARRLQVDIHTARKHGAAVEDRALREVFWKGLRQPEIRLALRHLYEQGGDFGNLVRQCRDVERDIYDSSHLGARAVQVHQLTGSTSRPDNTTRDQTSTKWNPQCWKCRKFGHIRKYCPDNANTGSSDSTPLNGKAPVAGGNQSV